MFNGTGADDADRAIVGEKGVTYGLQLATKPSNNSSGPNKNPAGVFGDDSSDSDDDVPARRAPLVNNKKNAKGSSANLVVGKMIARQMAAMDKDGKVKASHAEALREDASVFDYDVHVDAIQQARREKIEAMQDEKVQRRSKYISGLLETAEHRKKEQEVLFEKRLEKERQAEEAVYGTKEKFVTGAYRKKLEEEQRWKLEQEKKREADEVNAVEKKGSMVGFYANYLNVVGGNGGGDDGDDGDGGGNSGKRKAERPTREDAPLLANENKTTANATGGREQAGRQRVAGAQTGRNLEAEPPAAEHEERGEGELERAARLKKEREEKIAKAKARYAERQAKRLK